jgi:hypothetical protein
MRIQCVYCVHFQCSPPEPDLLDNFAHTHGLANPGSIQPQVRPGVFLKVATPK